MFLVSNFTSRFHDAHLGNEREPVEDLEDAVEVAGRDGVRDAVVVHDLNAAQLIVARVHLPPQHLGNHNQSGDVKHATLCPNTVQALEKNVCALKDIFPNQSHHPSKQEFHFSPLEYDKSGITLPTTSQHVSLRRCPDAPHSACAPC